MSALSELVEDYLDSLRLRMRSEGTITSYGYTLACLVEFIPADLADQPEKIRSRSISKFLIDRSSKNAPSTVKRMYDDLRTFFNWVAVQGEIAETPMRGVERPRAPIPPVPVIDAAKIREMLALASSGKYNTLRNRAILALLADTGMRASEVVNIKLSDIDWETQTIRVVGKGSKIRDVSFGIAAKEHLRRYIRARVRRRFADSEMLWLSHLGPMGYDALYSTIKRYAERVGISGVHPHMFRHTFAHEFRMNGASEEELMYQCGWSSTVMPRRYGASARAERAREAHRRFSPGDRL